MASEVKLPALGENVAGGDVVEVKVKVGDDVKEGQSLVELEAEKSTVEVPSPLAGRITQILIKRGDKVKTGQTRLMIEGNGKLGAAPPAAAAPPAPAPSPAAVQAGPAETPAPSPAAAR